MTMPNPTAPPANTRPTARMTSRQRMLTAMTHGVPDRVPCAPDTNWMIPARLVGGPFWQVYLHHDPPIWKAYNDCVRHFGVDGFSHHGIYTMPGHPDAECTSRYLQQTDERLVLEHTFRCPAGTLTQETTFLARDCPTPTKKWITDFAAQYDCLPYLCFGDVGRISFETYQQARADMGDHGVVGLCMNLPTLLTHVREPVEAAFYDYYDHHDQLTAFIHQWTEHLVGIAQAIIDQNVKPDFVFFPNSGMITMQSLEIMKEFSLPALRRLTRMFKQAGIVTSLHCCGKERALVELAADTDLDCIDPLEIPPMGDCNLREIKTRFGTTLALKGNLHTTEIMLRGTPAQVAAAARQCLQDAMAGGGYILSTGDQCGRDTPDENIAALIKVCETEGQY